MFHPLIILTGKTTSGKDTVLPKLLYKFPDLKRVITTTSRPPRAGEKNQVDYIFISEADFRKKIDQNDFIEWVEYGGNLYGTEKRQVLDGLDNNLIWKIDPSRAGQIRNFIKEYFNTETAEKLLQKVLVIYLTVDDSVVLQRLQKRGISEKEIEKRMQQDKEFWQQYKDSYDFVVENIPGKLDETVDKIAKIIENQHS